MIVAGLSRYLLRNVFLLARQLTGLGPHFAQVVSELAGVFFAHLVADLLELALRARAGCERLRCGALAGGFCGALNVVARLVQLLPLVGHTRLVLGAVHPLLKLVHVGQHLLFFLLKAFEAALQFRALLFVASFLQSGLQFFEAFVQILLAPGQFLQTVHHLQLFAALRGLWGLRLTLGFVAIFRLRHFHLLELPLHLLLAAAAALTLALRAGDLIFVLLKFEQGLVSSLFGSQRFPERHGRIGRLGEVSERLFHFLHGRGPERGAARVVLPSQGGLRLVKRLGL